MSDIITYGKKYKKLGWIPISFNITDTYNDELGIYKKKIIFKKEWQKTELDNCVKQLNKDHNGLGIITGSKSNIFVLDIDNKEVGLEEWNKLIERFGEPQTIKAKSGNGGFHYFFKYEDKLENIKGKDRAITINGKKLPIDVRTNGNNIIVEPSYYFNNNLDKKVEYEWIVSPFDISIKELPNWLYNMLCPIELKEKLEKTNEKIEIENVTINDESNNYEIIKLLINCLSESRSESEYTWMEVGWCLYNIEDSMRYLELWKDFSEKSEKYKVGECDMEWALMRDTSSKYSNKKLLKEGSLRYWANNDNRKKYKEITELEQLLKKTMNGASENISNLIYYINKEQFVCTNIKNNKWYWFNNTHWVDCDYANVLFVHIGEEISKFYNDIIQSKNETKQQLELQIKNLKLKNLKLKEINKKVIRRKESKERDDNLDENNNCMIENNKELENMKSVIGLIDKELKNIKKVIFISSDMSGKSKLMKECSMQFKKDKFEEQLDSNPNLIGFDNGIFDLNKMIFRKGEPNDCISFTTKYEYKPGINTIIRNDIFKFLEEILPNKETREYLLTFLGSALSGLPYNEYFHIHLGLGANGKSKLSELLFKSLGDYVGNLDVSYFTQKKVNSSQASPEVYDIKGKRIILSSEPNNDESLMESKVKQLTGGENITTRPLFGNMITFSPQCKCIISCNQFLKVVYDDGGMKRRLRIIDFPTKFVDNPVEENERKIDVNLSKKFDSWKIDFFNILVEYYDKFRKKNYKYPKCKEVEDNVMKYINKNNPYVQFVENNIVKTDDKKNGVSIINIWSEFKIEYNLEVKKHKINRKLFEMNLRKLLPKEDYTEDSRNKCHDRIINGFINGWRLLSDIENDTNKDDIDKCID